MGFDIRGGMIAKDFQTFLEGRLNSVFVGKEVRLSKIGADAIRNFTVNDFNLYNKTPDGKRDPAPVISVDRIIIRYNILDLLRRRFDRLNDVYLISPSIVLPSGDRKFNLPNASASFAGGAGYACPSIRFHILNGAISGADRKPVLTNLEGVVRFCDSTLILDDMKGSLLGVPVLVNGRIEHAFENPAVKLRISAQDKDYKVKIYFRHAAPEKEAAVYGKVAVAGKFCFDLKGNINVVSGGAVRIRDLVLGNIFKTSGDLDIRGQTGRFITKCRAGAIKVTVGLEGKDRKGLYARARLSHLNIRGFDVLSGIDINTELYDTADVSRILSGSLSTHNLIINYKPFKEINARWAFKKDALFINGIELGDEYKLSGSVKLTPPFDTNLIFAVHNAYPADWLIFSKYDLTGAVSGTMNGRLTIEGPLKCPLTKGRFEVRDGNLKSVKFNLLYLNLNGKGPIITIADSRISKEGGYLIIEGWFNVSQIGKRNIFEHVKIKTDQKIIVWEGWDIFKDADTSEIQLKKDITDEFKVNFRTHTDTDYAGREKQEGEVGLDYKIQKNDSINVRMKNDNTGFVGVEHKVKF